MMNVEGVRIAESPPPDLLTFVIGHSFVIRHSLFDIRHFVKRVECLTPPA